MIDFIPLEYYKIIWDNLLVLIVLLILMQSGQNLSGGKNLQTKHYMGMFLLVFILLYMGLRPISGKYFVDMRTYANSFLLYQSGDPVRTDKDVVFEYFMKFSSTIMSVETFFLVCTILYIVPVYYATKKIFNEYWAYAFILFLCSFTFWGAGVNGIRNGIAASLTMLAFAYTNQRVILIAIMFIAVSVHKSLILPALAYGLTLFHNDSKKYVFFWLLCIPLSLAAGGAFEAFFATLGFDDDRVGYLVDPEFAPDEFDSTRFRWDFLLYSATGVAVGAFFIFKKKFEDNLYQHLFNTYLITNAFWILVIRANFSNRFAYLSWFMLSIIIIYPFLKVQFYNNQHTVLARVIAVYYLFTYVLNFIL